MDFNFASYLLFDSGLDDFGLVEAFESDDIAWFALCPDHVNATEFSLPKWPSYFEGVKIPFAGRSFTVIVM